MWQYKRCDKDSHCDVERCGRMLSVCPLISYHIVLKVIELDGTGRNSYVADDECQ